MTSPGRVALGADPGLQLGFGVVRRMPLKLELIELGTIETKPERPLEERQEVIWDELTALIRKHQPVVIGYEDQAGVNAAARQSAQRAIAAARAGREVKFFGFNAANDGVIEVVGILKAAAFAYRVPLVKLQPRTIKVQLLGAGGGNGDKQAIKAAIKRLFPELEYERFTSHAADGTATAITAERVHFLESRRFG